MIFGLVVFAGPLFYYKVYQEGEMKNLRVAYSGIKGAFAYIAAKRIYPEGEPVSFPSFSDAFEAVVKDECDVAVLPIENSYAGEVGQVMDLTFQGDLHIQKIFPLHIRQNLVGIKGADINSIKTVVSHAQALEQCRPYLKEHGFEKIEAVNTAVAAKKVAMDNDMSVAAIASRETAELYGLEIIEPEINENKTNTTKFAVYSKKKPDPSEHEGGVVLELMFTVRHEAGALARALYIIGEYGFNMEVIRSRPVKTKAWEYYFYIEAKGNADKVDTMMEDLTKRCAELKFVGITKDTEGTDF